MIEGLQSRSLELYRVPRLFKAIKGTLMYYTNEGVGSTAIQVRFYRNAECVSLLRGICGLAALAKVVQKKNKYG